MYPAGTVKVGTSLQPGDQIAASVSRSGTSYTLALTDSTTPPTVSPPPRPARLTTCLDTSAEWIAERPSFSIGIAPLANYGTWTLANATQTANGKAGTIGAFSGTKYKSIMIDATQTYDLTTVSALTGGNSFFTTWHNWY